MLYRPIVLVLLLVAASPGAFWLFYGTLDPCDAVASRVLNVHAARGADTATGTALLRIMLADVTPPQCLEILWRLETGQGRP